MKALLRLLPLALLFSTVAFGQGAGTHGGHARICYTFPVYFDGSPIKFDGETDAELKVRALNKNKKPYLVSFTMVDFDEGQKIIHRKSANGASIQDEIHLPIPASGYRPFVWNHIDSSGRNFESKMNFEKIVWQKIDEMYLTHPHTALDMTDRFLRFDSEMQPLDRSRILGIDDADYPNFDDEKCYYPQFAVQHDHSRSYGPRYEIDEYLWNLADDETKAGLVLHELMLGIIMDGPNPIETTDLVRPINYVFAANLQKDLMAMGYLNEDDLSLFNKYSFEDLACAFRLVSDESTKDLRSQELKTTYLNRLWDALPHSNASLHLLGGGWWIQSNNVTFSDMTNQLVKYTGISAYGNPPPSRILFNIEQTEGEEISVPKSETQRTRRSTVAKPDSHKRSQGFANVVDDPLSSGEANIEFTHSGIQFDTKYNGKFRHNCKYFLQLDAMICKTKAIGIASNTTDYQVFTRLPADDVKLVYSNGFAQSKEIIKAWISLEKQDPRSVIKLNTGATSGHWERQSITNSVTGRVGTHPADINSETYHGDSIFIWYQGNKDKLSNLHFFAKMVLREDTKEVRRENSTLILETGDRKTSVQEIRQCRYYKPQDAMICKLIMSTERDDSVEFYEVFRRTNDSR